MALYDYLQATDQTLSFYLPQSDLDCLLDLIDYSE